MNLDFYVNGKAVSVRDVDPEQTLLQFLRSPEIGLTGTKLGCAEGGCGACTVLVSQYDPLTKRIQHHSVNACLAPLCSMLDKHVITVEGIGNIHQPHPIQERMAKLFGSQCGFCTPGIVMSLYALLRNNPRPTDHEIEEAFDGNLCRCTGYRPILDAAKSFSDSQPGGCGRKDCCQLRQSTDTGVERKDSVDCVSIGPSRIHFKPYDGSQELIFPPALLSKVTREPMIMRTFRSSRAQWLRPASVSELLKLKHEMPQSKIVCGNTEVGIEVKFKNCIYRELIYPMDIAELRQIKVTEAGTEIGACCTLTQIAMELRKLVRDYPEYQTRGLVAILENLKWFAGNQIRNVATIAGNIVTASPISDMNPVLVALGAVLRVQSFEKSPRKIPMDQFFLGYRKTALTADEVVLSVFVPWTRLNEFCFAYKQAKRRDDDISIVTACLRAEIDPSTRIVTNCLFSFGGMGPTTLIAKEAGDYCVGKVWSMDLLEPAADLMIKKDLYLAASAPGGMSKFEDLHILDNSAIVPKRRPLSKGTQVYVDSPQLVEVGKSRDHLSAMKQVTGEAVYLDDIAHQHRELYAGIVFSRHAHANIRSIDPAQALEMPGVYEFISSKDVQGSNITGPVFKDEEIFAEGKVYFVGQIIGLVLADTQRQAQEAARLVKVDYDPLPALISIEDAIKKQSFFPALKRMERGDVDKGFAEADQIIEGEIRMGGQEHFYLETQASLVIPKREDDEIEIWSSTQNPTETQQLVALALGILNNKVVCRVKRLGGGFGGKETRSSPLTCALAVAAKKVMRPVRCMLDRDEDMIYSGQRHPFLGRYKVGVKNDGSVTALDVKLYANAGYSADLSLAVVERAVSHSDNVYFIPNIRVVGRACKTNIHSNTAFRGFGGPQGMLVTETWINHVAETLKMDAKVVREKNMYREGELTHFNQALEDFHVPRIWNQILESSQFLEREKSVYEFNNRNHWKKRGLAIIPTKFGIAFTARFLNKAAALVHVYTDGSVLLSHGGTEMGQGLHTKCAQICADALGISLSQVHISETATDKVANTSPTAASASSDLNGMAVYNACKEIKDRLEPYFAQNPKATFCEIVKKAYLDRVNLSAYGFYKTPDLTYDWDTNAGRLFNYFTFGVAVTEVEVDTLTGDTQILRSDISMDLGKSLNPAIDIGQIEGAFVQGLGWTLMEESLHLQNGALFTRGPGNYKIPAFTDIPLDMRVSLFSESSNLRAVHSSKAVGEPPLFLGASAYFAVRDAVLAARKQNGCTEFLRLDSPATPESIRMACADRLVLLAKSIPVSDGEKPWSIRA